MGWLDSLHGNLVGFDTEGLSTIELDQEIAEEAARL